MKIIAAMLVCFTAVSIGLAQSNASHATDLSWSNGTAHDFGKILQNKPATCVFEFTNTGNQPVTITNVKPGCSCTVTDYTKEPIAPGAKGMVKIIYSAYSVGRFHKTAVVYTEPGKEVTILNISGEVVQKPEDASQQEATPRK